MNQNLNNKSVAVIILNYNGKKYLQEFLPSVVSSTYENLQIYVVDNNSNDDSVEFVEAQFKSVQLIRFDQNYGFTGGYNRALSKIHADYFILLNSDVRVESQWIEPLIARLESQPRLAAVQPKILAEKQKGYFEYAGASGGFLDMFGFPFCRGRIMDEVEADHQQYNTPMEVFWASGAALCIRKNAWEEAGGFDEDFFAHMEEVDLCWRLKRLGYSIGVEPSSQVYHVGGGTLSADNPQKTYLNFRNSLYMMHKNLPFIQAVFLIFARLWIDLAAIFYFLYKKKGDHAKKVSKAHQSFFYYFFRTISKRNSFQAPFYSHMKGFYKGSIVWDFHVNKIRKFSQIKSRFY